MTKDKKKGGKKGKDKQGSGLGRLVVGLVVLVAAGGGAMYWFAPEMLQQGLQMVGLDLPR